MERCKIKAAVRLRPLNDRERQGEPRPVWNVDNFTLTSSSGSFTYDHAFDGAANNWDVYEEVGRPIIDAFLQGFNATLLAYGQTASGKTHTIMGNDEQPGMIPLALSEIFRYVETQSEHREFILRCAYLEIYNEVLTDLLDSRPGSGKKVTIKEDPQGRVHVQGMCEQRILNGPEALQLLLHGEEVRKFAATAMNDRSSRSHTIYRLTLESKEIGGDMVKVSVLHLVDLAGSEKAHHSADQQRFKEGVKINLSLLHLGIVMSKLSNGEAHIPFRESKLTRILESSIGGNAKTTIVCTVSPLMTEETMSTLKFASRAMKIQNEAQVNEVPTSHEALLKKLKKVEEENRQLRMKISDADHLEKEKVKLETMDRTMPHHKEREKVWRRQTVCPSSFGRPDSPLLFTHFAAEAFSPKIPSQNRHSSDRRMSFFPIATAGRYLMASTDDEDELSIDDACDTTKADALDLFQLETTIPLCEEGMKSYSDLGTQTSLEFVDSGAPFAQMEQSVQTEIGCLPLNLLHCGVQTDEVEVLSRPIPLAQDNSKQKLGASTQTLETMHNLGEIVEAHFKHQLEGMRRDCESMYQQCDYERLEAIVQLEAANEEIGKLSVEIQELQKKLDTTDKQVEEQKMKNDELKELLDSRDLEMQCLKEKSDEATELSQVLMKKWEMAVLESEVMREQLEEANAAVEGEERLRKTAERGNLETKERIKELKMDIDALKEVLDQRDVEVWSLKKKSDEAAELNKKLMEKCETAAQESEMLAHMREQLEEANAAVQGEVAHRRIAEGQYLETKSKMSMLETEMLEQNNFRDIMKQQEEQLLGQIKELKTANDELKDVMDGRDEEMQSLKEKLKEANAAKEMEVARRRTAEEGYFEMKEKCDEFSSSHATLEQDLTILKEECESVKKNLNRIVEMKKKMELQRDDAGRQLDDLEERMEEMVGENEKLKQEAQTAKNLCDELSSSHAALEQDLTSSKEECESLKRNLNRIVEMKRKMELQRDDAGRQLDDVEERMEEIVGENEKLKQEAQAAKKHCDELSLSHAALEQDLTSSKEECESLKRNLNRIVEMKRKMELQRDEAGRQLDDVEERMEEIVGENEKLKQEAQAAKKHEWALESKTLSEANVMALEQIREERDTFRAHLVKAQDHIARLEGMLAPADVEELRKKLKAVVERTKMLEWQRNEEAKKVDRLREEMESVLAQNKQLSAKLKDQVSTQQLKANTQDRIGHGCGLSLEYETYQLRSQLGECKRREEKLNAICKQMQTEHRSALAKKDRQVQHLQRELERAQQQCEASKRRAAPLSCTFETGTASGPQRKCFQEHNITAEKKPASVKPTVVTSTVVPPVNRGGIIAQQGRKEKQPPFEWEETVNKSDLDSKNCSQQ